MKVYSNRDGEFLLQRFSQPNSSFLSDIKTCWRPPKQNQAVLKTGKWIGCLSKEGRVSINAHTWKGVSLGQVTVDGSHKSPLSCHKGCCWDRRDDHAASKVNPHQLLQDLLQRMHDKPKPEEEPKADTKDKPQESSQVQVNPWPCDKNLTKSAWRD